MQELIEKLYSVGIEYFSPSSLRKPMACYVFEYIYLTKSQRRDIIVGENAAFGTAVHGAIQSTLCAGIDIVEATEHALMEFDFHPADESVEKRQKYRDLIPAACDLAITELADWAKSEAELRVEWHPEELAVPIIGFVDMAGLQWPLPRNENKSSTPRCCQEGRHERLVKGCHAERAGLGACPTGGCLLQGHWP